MIKYIGTVILVVTFCLTPILFVTLTWMMLRELEEKQEIISKKEGPVVELDKLEDPT